VSNLDFSGDRWAIMRHLLVAPITLVLYILFAIGFTVYHKLEGHPLQPVWRGAYGAPFAVLNFFYNLTVGSFIWWELPREAAFTMRLKRKKEEGRGLAFHLCHYVNIYDPEHC